MDQKRITFAPAKNMNELDIDLSQFSEWAEVKGIIKIWANIKYDELLPVVSNWLVRTNDYSPHSLVDYINSKAHYGFKASTTGHDLPKMEK